MKQHLSTRELCRYLDGALAAEPAWELEQHLAGCSRCALLLERAAQLEETLHQAAERLELPSASHQRLARAVPLVAAAAAFTVWLAADHDTTPSPVRVRESAASEQVADGASCTLPDDGGVCSSEASPLASEVVDECGSCDTTPASAGGVCEAQLFTPLDG